MTFIIIILFIIPHYNKYKKYSLLRPQIAKANRGGRSYTQTVVKPVIIELQQYNNIKLNTILD